MNSKGDSSDDEPSNPNKNEPKSEDRHPNTSDQSSKPTIHIPFCLDHCSREEGEKLVEEYLRYTRQGPFALEEASRSETASPNRMNIKFSSTKSHVSDGKAHSRRHNAKRCSQGFRHHPYRSKEEEREMCFMPGQNRVSPKSNPDPSSNPVFNVMSKPSGAVSSEQGVAFGSKTDTTPSSNPNDDLSSERPNTMTAMQNEVPSVPSPRGSNAKNSPGKISEAGVSQEQDFPKKRQISTYQTPSSPESFGKMEVKRLRTTMDENNPTSQDPGTSQVRSQDMKTPVPIVSTPMTLRSHVETQQNNDVEPSTSAQTGMVQQSTGAQVGEIGAGERAAGALIQPGRLVTRRKGGKAGKWQKKSKKPAKKFGVKKLPKRRK